MDQSEHVQLHGQIETIFASIFRSAEGALMEKSGAPGLVVGDSLGSQYTQKQEDQQTKIDKETNCRGGNSDGMEAGLKRIALHASGVVAKAEASCHRRQSLAYLVYQGLTAVYKDMRARARRAFVSECAACIGRLKKRAASGQSNLPSGQLDRRSLDNNVVDGVIGPYAAWERERLRAMAEVDNEARRVARWSRLQLGVLRRSTGEVLRLLTVDSLRRTQVDGVAQWPGGFRQKDVGVSGGLESIEAVQKRARGVLSKSRAWQAEAQLEANSVQCSWMAALAHWKIQLGRALATAAKGDAAKLRARQKQDEEVGRTHVE